MFALDFDLVVFDLDGTLVDSEPISERSISKSMFEVLGVVVEPEEIGRRYRGRTLDAIAADLRETHSADSVERWLERNAETYYSMVHTEMEPSAGVVSLLEQLDDVPKCVASNSSIRSIRKVLEATGLDQFFGGQCFSGADIGKPKPAPDVYLTAASTMGYDARRTLAIEDTPLGAQAALSAGMDVIAYTGNHNMDLDLSWTENLRVIKHFDELLTFEGSES